MLFHVNRVDYAETTFPDDATWQEANLDYAVRGNVVVKEISAAPPGKHALHECERYEKIWRTHAAATISALIGEEHQCVTWAAGPVESDGLIQLLRYVDSWNDAERRYHIEGVTSRGGPGYHTSWVAFEFEQTSFSEIMADEVLDFEFIRLRMLVVADSLVDQVICTPFEDLGLQWILDNRAMALASPGHFEGCYLLGEDKRLDEGLARLGRVVRLNMQSEHS